MKKALELVRRLRRDEDGAALIEYTMLLGIAVVAVLGFVAVVAGWITTQWSTLAGAL